MNKWLFLILIAVLGILACRTTDLLVPSPTTVQPEEGEGETGPTPTPKVARLVPSETALPTPVLIITNTVNPPVPQSRSTSAFRPTPTRTSTPTTTASPTDPCSVPPTIEYFEANPSTIAFGQSTALSWGKVENATRATISPGIGGVGTPGWRMVNPANTTTYVLTAVGCGGTTVKQVTVIVTNSPPPVGTPTKDSAPTPTNGTPPPTAPLPPPPPPPTAKP